MNIKITYFTLMICFFSNYYHEVIKASESKYQSETLKSIASPTTTTTTSIEDPKFEFCIKAIKQCELINDESFDPNAYNRNGDYIFSYALANAAPTEFLQRLICHPQFDPNLRSHDDKSMIFQACSDKKNIKVIILLLQLKNLKISREDIKEIIHRGYTSHTAPLLVKHLKLLDTNFSAKILAKVIKGLSHDHQSQIPLMIGFGSAAVLALIAVFMYVNMYLKSPS